MSTATAVRSAGASSGARFRLAAALVAALPAVSVRLSGVPLGPLGKVAVFGLAVVATGFLLAWAAETAQLDISGSLATAVLAVIAVLPEYAVDLYFAFSAGHDPARAQFAAANMTGSNRLLIGIGWPLVVIVALFAFRRRRRGDDPLPSTASVTAGSVRMEPARRIDVGFLAAASLWAIVIVATRQIAWWSSLFLVALFGLYLWRLSREPRSEPELVGVPAVLGSLAPRRRRTVVIALFAVAAVMS